MGCFSIPYDPKSKHQSLPKMSDMKHHRSRSLPPSGRTQPDPGRRRRDQCTVEIGCSTPRFRTRTTPSPKLVKTHLGDDSPSFRKSSSFKLGRKYLHEDSEEDHSFYGNSHFIERFLIPHSAPLTKGNDLDATNESNCHLFPLPRPPSSSTSTSTSTITTDDTSTQSMSSTVSGSSTASSYTSTNHKHHTNTMNYRHTVEFLPVRSTLKQLPQPLPLPPPPEPPTTLREFSFDELAGACLNFAPEFFIRNGGAGPVYKAVVRHASDDENPMEVTVTRLFRAHTHSFKKWKAEVESLARLSHPHLCKVLGYSSEDPSEKTSGFQRDRLLVYENAPNGSLESLLYCRKDRAPLDWSTRLRIALGSAQGLAYLHERTPRQIVYKAFKTLNIQVDENYNAKLCDYGFARSSKDQLSTTSPARPLPQEDAYSAPETRDSNLLTPKSNVWSFGIVLLELLTGRQNMDAMFPEEERDLLQWCRPYLLDAKRLYLVMDPELKGRYPTRVAKMVADLALLCLVDDPDERPSMKNVVDVLATHVKQDITDMSSPSTNRNQGYVRTMNMSGRSKFRLSKSHSLVSVLASPGRPFTQNMQERYRNYYSKSRETRGFLSGEFTKGTSPSATRIHHPFFTRPGFLSGEVVPLANQ